MPDHADQIRSVLIANRGEIAVRIARTASRLGIRSIGIHEAGDRPPDGLDPVMAVGSYLDGSGILDAAWRTGADAIHPGYGFLAEIATLHGRGRGRPGVGWPAG